jgi:hypothetical protein
MFVRTKWLKKYPFSLDYVLAADYDNFCLIMKDAGRAGRVPAVISHVTVGGVSRSNRLAVYREYEAIHDLHFGNNLSSRFYFIRRKLLVNLKRLLLACRRPFR